ncbi:hypothetical protein EXS70_03585 [Candidatus Peribacteria bacterium]|nr:hypothetical protein [Candidatus Peribacteria bacterium]
MDLGYVLSLRKDALADEGIPSMEKVFEAYQKGENADAYMVGYLKHRPELVELIRILFSDSLSPFQYALLIMKARNPKLREVVTEAARLEVLKFVHIIEKDPDRKELLASLTPNPATIIWDCERVALAKELLK